MYVGCNGPSGDPQGESAGVFTVTSMPGLSDSIREKQNKSTICVGLETHDIASTSILLL